MIARLNSYVDRRSNGVVITVEVLDDRTHQVVNFASVIYTPEQARQVAQDVVVQADKADALGGPSEELMATNTDRGGTRFRSPS